MVGSAIVRKLLRDGFTELILPERIDLRGQYQARELFMGQRPEYVFLAAAKVGGILANSTRPAEFIYDNLMIQANVIEAAYQANVKKILVLGSSCIYPRMCLQPIVEESLLCGPLEPTNQWYAVAKIAGIKLAQAYRAQYGFNAICAMPTNLYGQNDNFDLESGHVLPALIRRIHEAKIAGVPEVQIWGTGKARREFLHVDDLAEAAVMLMEHYESGVIINVGAGYDLTIRDLADLIAMAVGYSGRIATDPSKPDGTPQKLLCSRRISDMGWKPQISLSNGIETTYQHYLKRNVVEFAHADVHDCRYHRG